MMLTYLKNELNRLAKDGWEITDTKTRGWEFYFIRHRLDQNRAKDIETIRVTVFRKLEDGAFIGTADAEIPVTASHREITLTIEKLLYQASLVKNKPYTLNSPKAAQPLEMPPIDLRGTAADFIRAIQGVPETPTEDINSYEIFCDDVTVHYMNSEGVDVSQRFPSAMAEVVVNARKDDHEIELYRMYRSGSCDAAKLQSDLTATLKMGRDRLVTQPTPVMGSAPVIFSTDAAIDIYAYFLDQLSAQMVCRKMSSFVIGEPITEAGAAISGDPVTLKTVRYLPNSSKNRTYDEEGAPIRDEILLDRNVPKAYWGDRMFASYIGLEDAFSVTNWEVTGGTGTEAALRTGDYLEVVEFSDFQVDPLTGDIFGEIRLAYWHDEAAGTVIPVTGGSVSGNMRENLDTLKMSENLTQYNHVRIPAVTRLQKMTVAGVEA